MGITEFFDPGEQQQRVQRSILLFIILATLPCYCVGAILLGVAPDNDDPVVQATEVPPIITTTTITATVSITPALNTTPSATLPNTPGQFNPPTNTPIRINTPTTAPTVTPSPTTQEPNQPPIFTQLPGSVSLTVGEVVDAPFSFADPNSSDIVTATASSSNSNVATVFVINNNAVRVTGVSTGTASITVTLNDGNGGTVQASFTATVSGGQANQDPVFNQLPAAMSMGPGTQEGQVINASDPDSDPITIIATSNNPDVASASASGTTVTITAGGEGVATITVTLSDGNGGSAQATFTVTVSSDGV
ncbi:MAG: Ig-like domain-containing protein [Chloroflexi bacterium]|nr:Ig-like domain-containing protein [Chloroflexota bacterium]